MGQLNIARVVIGVLIRGDVGRHRDEDVFFRAYRVRCEKPNEIDGAQRDLLGEEMEDSVDYFLDRSIDKLVVYQSHQSVADDSYDSCGHI